MVMPMTEAAKIGDIFITVTGNFHVIAGPHFEAMKNGAIVCNSGHFNDELDLDALEAMSTGKTETAYVSSTSTSCRTAAKSVCSAKAVSSTSRPPKAIPAMVMDMSFANQAMAAGYLAQNYKTLEKKV